MADNPSPVEELRERLEAVEDSESFAGLRATAQYGHVDDIIIYAALTKRNSKCPRDANISNAWEQKRANAPSLDDLFEKLLAGWDPQPITDNATLAEWYGKLWRTQQTRSIAERIRKCPVDITAVFAEQRTLESAALHGSDGKAIGPTTKQRLEQILNMSQRQRELRAQELDDDHELDRARSRRPARPHMPPNPASAKAAEISRQGFDES